MRVLVSGVGRSATTMLYQHIGQMISQAFRTPRYRYEPYLWRLNMGRMTDASFGPAELSTLGMHTHQLTPLFLQGAHPVHDVFIDDVFGKRPTMEGDPPKPDAWLVKIIRGSGRLESYLKALPDLKIVICTRNPIDTLNSSLGMFSFTGEEFHRSDASRLVSEVRQHFPDLEIADGAAMSHLAISAIWWRTFTEWSLDVAARYPARCHVFRHEAFAADRNGEIERLTRFLGFSTAETFKIGLAKSAGPKISSRHLLNSDIAQIDEHLTYYLDHCLAPAMVPDQLDALKLRIWAKNGEREFAPQIAAGRLGQKSTLQLRGDILAGREAPERYVSPKVDDPARIPLQEHLKAHCKTNRLALGDYKAYAPVPSAHRRHTFGCCITSFNSRETIRDAVFSALDQTRPFDRIVVVDDASTDGTQAVLADLEYRYASVSVIYKKHNGGVSAARNTGFQALGTSHLTQLDGDDCFWPTKNRAEAEVVFDDPEAVAFSPTMVDQGQNGALISQHHGYAGDCKVVFENLLSRIGTIPRDMTFSTELYRRIGGYDVRLSLYEDWDLKLRLARATHAWRMSDSKMGTVYNRRTPGLSSGGDREHVHALTYVFVKAALASPHVSGLSHRYVSAVAPRRQQLTQQLQALMARCDAGELAVEALKPLTSRAWMAMREDVFGNELDATLSDPAHQDGTEWQVRTGFENQVARLPSIERSSVHWLNEPQGVIALIAQRQFRKVEIEIFNPISPNRVEVEVLTGSRPVFKKQFDVEVGKKKGKWLQPKLLVIDRVLDPGEYQIVIRIQPIHEEVSDLWQAEGRRLHLALTEIRAASEGAAR